VCFDLEDFKAECRPEMVCGEVVSYLRDERFYFVAVLNEFHELRSDAE
jgi:hypothetical protein